MFNEYYIFLANELDVLQSNDLVEFTDTVRWNNDKTKFACKTLKGLKNVFPNPFTHEQILVEMAKTEWVNAL